MAEEPPSPSPPLVSCPDPLAPSSRELEAGVAAIKPEYVVPHVTKTSCTQEGVDSELPPPSKKRRRGQNKHRPRPARIDFSEMLCPSLHDLRTPATGVVTCLYKEKCRYMHDVAKFMANKPPDVGDHCYVFEKLGKCSYGASCRFGSSHVTSEFVNVVQEGLYDPDHQRETCNLISKELQEILRKRKLSFERTERYLARLGAARDVGVVSKGHQVGVVSKGNGEVSVASKVENQEVGVVGKGNGEVGVVSKVDGENQEVGVVSKVDGENQREIVIEKEEAEEKESTEALAGNKGTEALAGREEAGVGDQPNITASGAVTDEGEVRLRPCEKTKIDFQDKLYLAPLTTTGNLPFRRICKEFGADITCGEMAMCTNLLQGQQSEWALLKRHQSEDLFGVQICGSHADTMTRCAELINDHTSVDFVDINTGCPIDLVFKKGAGSALMGRHTRFEGIVRGMVEVLDCPLTVKMRTGIYKKNWNAHKLVPKLREWGVSMATVHGRSREQRYTKQADWGYIRSCVEVATPMPLFGNGDILSYEDYHMFCEESGVAGCMIARGALIKPWVFTEIKEQRHWDIRSSERLEILQRYTNYGLEHWGSDAQGVENTRKFLLEWLSFLHRYIPVGVLERVPQKINQRPPCYQGRDDLETIMASSNCQDWIKISEMLLGPAPGNFSFIPKHRANSYN